MTDPGPSGRTPRKPSADSAQGDEIQAAGSLAGGFGVVPNEAWTLPLGQIAQALYVRLVCYVASGRGSCWPGQASLAADLGCTDRSIRNAMTELTACGLVTEQRRGRNLTNVYAVHGPEAHHAPPKDEGPEPRSAPPTGSTFRSGEEARSGPDRNDVPGNNTRGGTPAEQHQQLPPTPRAPLAGQPLEEEGSRMLEVTTREHAARQPCGSCGAEPGRPCIGNRGQERESLHASRHAAAIAAGAPVLAPQERGGRPRARRRGSREQGTNPRALGTNPRARTGPPPEPPTDALADAWHKIHAELEHAATASAWALYLEPLKLAGTRGAELVLHAPPGRGSWTGDQFGRLLTAAARAHLGAVTTVAVLEAEAVAA